MKHRVLLYDSTLRDGAQAEGISFSVEDKLKIVKKLDEIGIHYIEAGNPASNPKDLEFFEKVAQLELKNTQIVAFGSTRRRGTVAAEDTNVQSLLKANTKAVAIFGKTWDLHVTEILKASLQENLEMIRDTIAFLKDRGKEVIFDAEHFFDGYKANSEYALQSLKTAQEAGADVLVLCDTNGGCFPFEITEIIQEVKKHVSKDLGIHCHNDTDMAVGNTIHGVLEGVVQVQGTFNGIGERCGNANLCTIIPNLQLKLGYSCIEEAKISKLTEAARYVSEIANIPMDEHSPYVGRSAFTHKAGMHIDGVQKISHSFEHVPPSSIGNERRFLLSEVAGRSTILKKIQQIAPNLTKESHETQKIMNRLKELEYQGYQFEGAEGGFELVIRKELGKYKPFFELIKCKVIGDQPQDGMNSSAMIKIAVDGKEEISAAEGDGPVHAMDLAMRKALEIFYPNLRSIKLTDYKVRVLDTKGTTAAKVRVLIESSDQEKSWTTVGVSTDIIEASLIALVDSIEYKLLKDLEEKIQAYL